MARTAKPRRAARNAAAAPTPRWRLPVQAGPVRRGVATHAMRGSVFGSDPLACQQCLARCQSLPPPLKQACIALCKPVCWL